MEAAFDDTANALATTPHTSRVRAGPSGHETISVFQAGEDHGILGEAHQDRAGT